MWYKSKANKICMGLNLHACHARCNDHHLFIFLIELVIYLFVNQQ